MVNTTKSATVELREEGNYTCLVTNKYGTDIGKVSVIFTGKMEHLYNYFYLQGKFATYNSCIVGKAYEASGPSGRSLSRFL